MTDMESKVCTMCVFLDRNGNCPKVGIKSVDVASGRCCRFYRDVRDMESANAKICEDGKRIEDIKEFPDCHASNISEEVKVVDASRDGRLTEAHPYSGDDILFDSSTGIPSNYIG